MKTMDRRIAERRQQVSEEKARGRLRWLIWLVVAVAGIALVLWAINSPLLSIRTVSVTGAERSDPAAMAANIGVEPGIPTFSVRAGAIESAVEADPWVERATVTVSWPGTIEIDVVERVAVASIVTDTGTFLVAADGVLVDRIDGAAIPPEVVTDVAGVTRVGTQIGHTPTAGAIDFVAALPPELGRSTTLTVTGDTVDATVAGYTVIVGRPTDMAAKATAVAALIGTGITPGSRIDVTAPTRPAVAPPQSQLEGETKTLEESQPSD